jgi:hypothetical protein
VEIHLPRREIRRRIQARLGFTTNDAQAPLVMEQINEWIRAAASEVYKRCPWAQTQQETTAEVGIDQRFIDYPQHAGPGNIIAIGLWFEGETRYRQLRRGRIPVTLDDDPIVDTGEPDSVAARATPSLYELKNQIELWPRADQAYRLKIDHTISPEIADDTTDSVVDAEAIILHVMAEAYDNQGDDRLADGKRRQFEAQIARLIGEQSPMQQMRRGRYDRLSVGRRTDGNDYVPDSGTWPSRAGG